MTDQPIVAVIGTGRMGAAMAGTLRRAGFDVVVFNRSPASAQDVAAATGARVGTTAGEAAAEADIVVSSLADDAALEAVYLGPDGVVAGLRPGTVVADTSTIDPGTIRDLLPSVLAAGSHLIDAPVSGSVQLVEAGKLTIMVGGDAAALELARPALEALSAQIFHLGPLGAGATMKLAVNALVHATNTALSEALVLAEKAGVDRAMAYEVFAAGAGGSPFVAYKKEAYLHPDEATVAFSLDLAAKDLRLILGLARRVGLEMRQGSANLAVTETAIDRGFGAHDMSALAAYLRA
ncbi:MAG: NAD(P)-dependent oxidoreductase [Acidimicrobiia bacterium]|nr:NAD(P)-dependent oxidoreductase [Acidimicrobiia bacterium]